MKKQKVAKGKGVGMLMTDEIWLISNLIKIDDANYYLSEKPTFCRITLECNHHGNTTKWFQFKHV